MNKNLFVKSVLVLLSATLLPALASAQDKATIRVSTIKTTPSLLASLDANQKQELGRITESLDSHFIASFNATHKFDVVGGSDLKDIIGNQDLENSGNFDPKTVAKTGALSGAKYVLVTKVNNYQDNIVTATFEGTGRSATRREFVFSANGTIYDIATGKELDSVDFEIAHTNKELNLSYTVKNGNLSDEMIDEVASDMAGKIANHSADYLFPAKILAKRDTEVTINRGDGAGVTVGDTFNVYAVGDEMFDPDTKESLGREEVKVGQVKITEVDPKFSKAQILSDTGIANGAILRKPQ
jgi:hypothetical protein